ncbi:hypothetical protein ACFU6R_28565 [Streptomyces sp. NPDC057499]|uniref:hypothetical protein n=1 Tax=Streptomyces sp. NPDC057499 TaxID=3346150 RepID=UPI00369BDC78
MSRTQWYCLTAVLAVVLGLFCGPGRAPVTESAAKPVASAALPTAASAAADADPDAPDAPVVAADSGRRPLPGCGRTRKQDDAPSLPGRSRSAYDQAPGLAGWGLPAATGQAPVHPPARPIRRAPVSAAPTPVELSVLRV